MADPEGNREEILANFQGCTGIEDVEEAIMWLEESDWDLLGAIKRAIPQETDVTMHHAGVVTQTNGSIVPVTLSPDFAETPSTSQNSDRQVFFVEVTLRYGDETVKLMAPENMNYGGLQLLIFSETGVPPCNQRLTGWEFEPSSENTTLAEMNVNLKLTLLMLRPYQGMNDPLTSHCLHLVVCDATNNKDYNLRLPAGFTVGEVKHSVFLLTSVPLPLQIWRGWPAGLVDDHQTIGSLDLDRPVHRLLFDRAVEPPVVPPAAVPQNATVFIDLTDSDSSPEDFEDASESFTGEEEIFHENVPLTRRTEPLIPDNVEDETAGSVHFIDGYTRRYGNSVPNFLPGSFEDAIREACMRPARERRILAVYLHHDGSVLTNVFCTEILGSETVLQTFQNYFVLWGWDLTNEANKNMFLASAMKNLDSPVADTVRDMSTEQLPALMLLTRNRSSTELFNVIYGNIGLNDFLGLLMQAIDLCSDIQENEIKEEEERAARERIKSEQDHAFQQSLLMDRAKEEAKKKQQQLNDEEEQRKQQERAAEEKKRCTERTAALAKIPTEPVEGAPDVVKLRFRAPTGSPFERRFLSSDILESVFNYLLVSGFRIEEYKLITSWPRRDISTCEPTSTLKNLNLHSQETLILEER